MQPVSLSIVQPTQTQPRHSQTDTQSSGFSEVLSGVVETTNRIDQVNVDIQGQIQFSNEEQLMKQNILTLSEMRDLVQLLLTNDKMLSVWNEEGIDQEDLNIVIQAFDEIDENNTEVISILSQILLSMSNNWTVQRGEQVEIGSSPIQKFQSFMAGRNENSLIPELKKVLEKVETVLKDTSQSNRREYLNQLFSIVNKDVNEQNVNQIKLTLPLYHEINQPRMVQADQLNLIQGQSGKMVSTEELIQQFESILAKGQFGKNNGSQKLFIKLYPEHLGALRIELIQKDSILMAKIMTTTLNAKEMLESQLQNLKQVFSAQNIQVEKLEISSQLTFHERLNRDSQQQQQQQEKQQQQNNHEHEKNNVSESFAEVLFNEGI